MLRQLDMPHASARVPLGRRVKKWLLARPWVARLGVVLLLFIVWELVARFVVDKIFLSPPSQVFTQLPTVFQTPGVSAALPITAFELAIAFALSVVIGIVVGLT